MGHVVAGLTVMMLLQQAHLPSQASTIAVFTFFLLLNLVYIYAFRLHEAFRRYWSLRRVGLLLAGIAAGIGLVCLPKIAALAAGKVAIDQVRITDTSVLSIVFTFLVTGWEELWFRTVLLNHTARHISSVSISLTVGVLFMLLHLLNPEINLLVNGPVLFLAGTLLTALYFYYHSIWVPVGLHFANNFFGSYILTSADKHPVFGSEGYIYTALLALATAIFIARLSRRERIK